MDHPEPRRFANYITVNVNMHEDSYISASISAITIFCHPYEWEIQYTVQIHGDVIDCTWS